MKGVQLIIGGLFTIFSQYSLASPGPLFKVKAVGNPQEVSITLCLNGNGPMSCQKTTVSALNLTIRTTIPHHTYSTAGIKVNTPGFSIANLGVDCKPNRKGYCLFSLSDTVPKKLTLVSVSLSKIKHFVIIYEENHSFDNLYGCWEGVNGIAKADPAHTIQVSQANVPFSCLLQVDPHFTSPSPLSVLCTDMTAPMTFSSHFFNEPFVFDDFVPNSTPLGGGNNPTHRFYQQQYQINGGKQNRFVTGNSTVGFAMGVYDTKQLPIYQYLHQNGHPDYAILDNFFHAAFGGSTLNGLWLISANTPKAVPGTFIDGRPGLHSVIDTNGMPANYPLYQSPLGNAVVDGNLAVACQSGDTQACGNYIVNNMNSLSPLLTTANIGDSMSNIGIEWAWYSGEGLAADEQPFIFYANYAPCPSGTVAVQGFCIVPPNQTCPAGYIPAAGFCITLPNPLCPSGTIPNEEVCVLPQMPVSCPPPFSNIFGFCGGSQHPSPHLLLESDFERVLSQSANTCQLKQVSFVKPALNEHPGQDLQAGDAHLVSLIQSIETSACAKDTMIIVTYDENGGAWDHVSPPGQARNPGPHDVWGPGTRVPTLVISPFLKGNFVVDHTQYDTTSILALLEQKYGLQPLGTRDAAVNSLAHVFKTH